MKIIYKLIASMLAFSLVFMRIGYAGNFKISEGTWKIDIAVICEDAHKQIAQKTIVENLCAREFTVSDWYDKKTSNWTCKVTTNQVMNEHSTETIIHNKRENNNSEIHVGYRIFTLSDLKKENYELLKQCAIALILFDPTSNRFDDVLRCQDKVYYNGLSDKSKDPINTGAKKLRENDYDGRIFVARFCSSGIPKKIEKKVKYYHSALNKKTLKIIEDYSGNVHDWYTMNRREKWLWYLHEYGTLNSGRGLDEESESVGRNLVGLISNPCRLTTSRYWKKHLKRTAKRIDRTDNISEVLFYVGVTLITLGPIHECIKISTNSNKSISDTIHKSYENGYGHNQKTTEQLKEKV